MSNTEVLFNEFTGPKGVVGLITLNRPKVLNALSIDMFITIKERLEQWQHNPEVNAVIIEGAGERAFCAGGDIRAFYDNREQQQATDKPFYYYEYALNHLIYVYPKPYIALLDGITMGGGAGVSIHGRWRIATERFVFAMPETAIGFFPDIGAAHFLNQLPFRIGHYLALTGNQLHANDALALGLIDGIVSSKRLAALRGELLAADYRNNGDATVMDILKRYQKMQSQADLTLLEHAELIERHFSSNSVDQILHSLSQSEDVWCQQTLATLQKRSPTSLKVTLRHLQHCEQLPLVEVLQEDACLADSFIHSHDFYEGIRTTLIDKQDSPSWKPPTLAKVTEDQVNRFF